MSAADFFLLLLAVASTLQFFLFLGIFLRFARKKEALTTEDSPPVSIVICARNEAENLLKNLPLLMKQDYPQFEVIVVDDCSYDDTEDVLRAFKERYPRFRTSTVKESERFRGGKKIALTIGIKAASYDIILLTDADCVPSSPQWIRSMAAGFRNGKEIVLGYGKYENTGTWLNRLIRFDTFLIGLQYFSLALAGMPYMGVGRNMGYKKDLFFRRKGFASDYSVPSGDDDLFVNRAATLLNTSIVTSPEAHTVSAPKSTFHEWLLQKSRHISVSPRYKGTHKAVLFFIILSQYLFFVSLIALLISGSFQGAALALFTARLAVQLYIYYHAMRKLNERDLLLFFPLLEMLLLIIYPIFAGSNLFCKLDRWKN